MCEEVFCSCDVLLSDASADVCKRQRTCLFMLWLDVVEITDCSPSCFMHALLVSAPAIDGFKMIELGIVDKSKCMIFKSRTASDKMNPARPQLGFLL